MKPTIQNLGTILYSPNQYIVPVFQRHYRWERPQWDKLWENICELRRSDKSGNHFMGFLVFVPSLPQPGRITIFYIIDGQQRLTTLCLLLIALRNVARAKGFADLAEEIHDYYLIHPPRRGDERFRLFPKDSDKASYLAAVMGTSAGGRVSAALEHFEGKLGTIASTDSDSSLRSYFDLVCRRLEFMCATLEQENPYNIFKSLNSTGVPLGAADLIRNFVFMHIAADAHDEFDSLQWRPLESNFVDAQGNFSPNAFSEFFRHFLMSSGRYVRPVATFETFEERYEGTGFSPVSLACELSRFAGYYLIISGKRPDGAGMVTMALRRLNALESSTTYPLLLKLFNDRGNGALSDVDLVTAIDSLSGFILRRFVVGESSRGYGPLFVRACEQPNSSSPTALQRYLESKGWPDASRFAASFVRFNLYQRGYGRFILEELERAKEHKEPADLQQTEIEHVMPQTLSDEWRRDLGSESERVYTEWLHTPGNLTLSAYNRELWNHPFHNKRVQYAASNVTLTRELAERSTWAEQEITERGEELAQLAVRLWLGPAAPVAPIAEPRPAITTRDVISVMIRWTEAGRDIPDETISEQHSSTTVAKLLGRIVAVIGETALERLAQITTGRGPLVSDAPARDFLNPSSGQLYANQAIPSTDWFVLTNNSSSEKIELVREIPARLGFSPKMLSVAMVSKPAALLHELAL